MSKSKFCNLLERNILLIKSMYKSTLAYPIEALLTEKRQK